MKNSNPQSMILSFENRRQLRFSLKDNAFVQKWVRLLRQYVLNLDYKMETTARGLGEASVTSLEGIHQRLFETLSALRSHTDQIEIMGEFKNILSLSELNEIHRVYEGVLANLDTLNLGRPRHESMRLLDRLNDAIHHYEGLVEGHGPEEPRLRLRFLRKDTGLIDVQKPPLSYEDKSVFQYEQRAGGLYLNYCICGRSPEECFLAGAPLKEALPLPVYSPAFFVRFHAPSLEQQLLRKKEFYKWLREEGVNPEEHWIVTGVAELALLDEADLERVQQDLSYLGDRPSISSIAFE